MAKIKIILEKGESPEQVEEELIKAISQKAENAHPQAFDDPVLKEIELKWGAQYVKDVIERSIQDIVDELKSY